MNQSRVPELPTGIQLIYLAEGAANIVYRILPSSGDIPISELAHYAEGTPQPTEIEDPGLDRLLEGKLLRLRKDLKHALPYKENAWNFDRVIRPLFSPDELVDQILVVLPSGLVHQCNEQLRADEKDGKRPENRRGIYLSTAEPFGLLVTDMTSSPISGSTTIEFKPKWLVQSPSAPAKSSRCRTCALREMKNQEARNAETKEVRSFCPLDLISDKIEDVRRATQFLKGCRNQSCVTRCLYQNSTILKLQAHQSEMNDVGLYGQPPQSHSMSASMSLRDCTMFIKIPYDKGGPFEVRLGDLDLKVPSGGKAQYWLDIEKRLIQDGWYVGERMDLEGSECALARS
jgi:inositol-pentakisphosphate 2-kinase